MAERQESMTVTQERYSAIFSLLAGALIWGVIWFPYRLLRDAGIDGIVASTTTYGIALVLGLIFFRRTQISLRPSWTLFWLAIASGGCNIGYVLATLNGEVVRVLLLFYLAPLWTILLSRFLLGERLNRFGVFVIALSLAGAITILWHPGIDFPVPQKLADWFGLGAGFSFALFNVLSRRAQAVSIQTKSLVSFAGPVFIGLVLIMAGFGTVQIPGALSVWLMLGLIGMVLVVANLIVQYGLARVAANRAIVIMLSEVGFAAVSAWLFADESLGWREWVGGAMIVVASVFSAKMDSGAES